MTLASTLGASPQAQAFLYLDRRSLVRAFGALSPVAVALLVLFIAIPPLAPLFLAAFDPAGAFGMRLAQGSAILGASIMLATLGGLPTYTRARSLLISLPLKPRTVWESLAWRFAFLVAGFGILLLVGIAWWGAGVLPDDSAAGYFLGLHVWIAWIVLALSTKYVALLAAGCRRSLRWALWGTLTSFAAAPLLVLLGGADLGVAAALSGPSFAVLELARAAAHAGWVGALAFGAVSFAVCAALAGAPLPPRALEPRHAFPEEAIALPFPQTPFEELQGVWMANYAATRVPGSAPAAMDSGSPHAAASAQRSDDVLPLPLPDGRKEALASFKKRGLTRSDWLAVAFGGVVLVVMIAVLSAVAAMAPRGGGGGGVPTGLPTVWGLIAGLWLLILSLVALMTSPGFSARERAKLTQRLSGESPKKRSRLAEWASERPKPGAAVIRAWAHLQSLPVTREEMAYAFLMRTPSLLRGLAVLAVFVAGAYLVFRPGAFALAFLGILVAGTLAFVSCGAVPSFLYAHVPRDVSLGARGSRALVASLWIFAGLLLFVGCLGSALTFAQTRGLGTGGFIAVTAALVSPPALFALSWRTRALGLVISQKPYLTRELFTWSALGGAGFFALSLTPFLT